MAASAFNAACVQVRARSISACLWVSDFDSVAERRASSAYCRKSSAFDMTHPWVMPPRCPRPYSVRPHAQVKCILNSTTPVPFESSLPSRYSSAPGTEPPVTGGRTSRPGPGQDRGAGRSSSICYVPGDRQGAIRESLGQIAIDSARYLHSAVPIGVWIPQDRSNRRRSRSLWKRRGR